MKLTEKDKNAIVNEALFNLGAYFVTDDRGYFEDCQEMEHMVYALLEEIWEPETKMETTVFGLMPVPTEEDAKNLSDITGMILSFIEAHGEVRDWLFQILKENLTENYETMKEAYDSFKKIKYGDKDFDWFI